ncbi:MAG: hypothetical protein OXK77_10685 [Gemmatimonadota bacterium]|nr:hypothetical protein [Gemmatimonadota bacterium]MDE2864153.1 hypothetical protein [Gemmatimonadota bacterium]MYB07180.1 hypothetical protein [Gemmatimonadota bacterium]MYG21472.1 hypothetical protein [Gemmatimonadota bacterium]MYJ38080.1 hypothetical protein [Gemmatimonadota bacterium]
MRTHTSTILALAMVATGATFACAPAADESGQSDAAMADEAAAAAPSNPRFGVWRLESDAPPPASNIMTYEPWGDGGMKITVASTTAEGESSEWSYATLFDGVFRPVEGQENATTAVEVVDDRTNHILNARDGDVYQVIVNVLSEDGNTINNEYRRTLPDGTERISHAVYRRIE